MSNLKYLVPHDFTKVGDAAFDYALFLAKKSNAEIILLHIVASKDKISSAEAKLMEVAKGNKDVGSIEVGVIAREGSIFDDIGKIATATESSLIIMGTHGATGMQKVFGSYAIKVVRSTGVPFLVVQGDVRHEKIDHIVAPLDLTRESLQIMTYAAEMAKLNQATVHVVYEGHSDPILATQLRNRTGIVLKEFDERKVPVIFEALKGSGAFHKKVIEYGQSVSVDLYAAAFHTESLLPQFEKLYQTLITNDHNTPCMIVNAKESSNIYF
jgi:nucleotide-binding universal stress UspA family protein